MGRKKKTKSGGMRDGQIISVEETLLAILQIANKGSNQLAELALTPRDWRFESVIEAIGEASRQIPPEIRHQYVPYRVQISRFLVVQTFWKGQVRECASEPMSVSVPYFFGRIVGPFEAAQLLPPQLMQSPDFIGAQRVLICNNGGVQPLKPGDDIEVFPEPDSLEVKDGDCLREAKLNQPPTPEKVVIPEPEPSDEPAKPQATEEQVRDAIVEAAAIVEARAKTLGAAGTPELTEADLPPVTDDSSCVTDGGADCSAGCE